MVYLDLIDFRAMFPFYTPWKQNTRISTDFKHLLSVRAVLFEVSYKSISRKSLSLIKIEYCLGGVYLIQSSWHMLFLSNNRSSHQRLALENILSEK